MADEPAMPPPLAAMHDEAMRLVARWRAKGIPDAHAASILMSLGVLGFRAQVPEGTPCPEVLVEHVRRIWNLQAPPIAPTPSRDPGADHDDG